MTDDNLVCTTRQGLRTPDGVIDFGDSTISWAVGELAVAITSVLRHAGAEPCSTLPATQETMAICDRMLSLGVVIQPTGDRMCVLKIKPPLCLDTAGADFFADALDRVLTQGW